MTIGNRVAAVAVMVALFLIGGVAGGVTVLLLRPDPPPPGAGWAGPGDGPGGRGGLRGPRGPRGVLPRAFVDRLARDLELSDAQRDSVEAILEEQRRAAQETLREMAPRLRAGLDSTHQQIRRLLDEAQRQRFDSIVEHDRGMLDRRFQRGGRGGGPRR